MNYILQLNAFWKQFEDEPVPEFTFQYRGVYLVLLKLNNDSGWKKKFTATYTEVNKLTGGIAKRTYYDAIKFLTERKLILYFKSCSKWQASFFTILRIYSEKAVLAVPSETDRKPVNDVPVSEGTDRKPIGNRYETDRAPIHKPNKPSKPIKLKKLGDGTSLEVPVRPSSKFEIPTKEEIEKYMIEKKNFHLHGAKQFAEKFWESNNAKGWLVGKTKTPMKSWTSAVATWLSDGEFKNFIRKETSALPVSTGTGTTPSTPAPAAPSKADLCRITYRDLLLHIRAHNKFMTGDWYWMDIWTHLTLRNRTEKISASTKERIRIKVKDRLLQAAQAKAQVTHNLIQRETILKEALKDLDKQCKREFCLEYFSKFIKSKILQP